MLGERRPQPGQVPSPRSFRNRCNAKVNSWAHKFFQVDPYPPSPRPSNYEPSQQFNHTPAEGYSKPEYSEQSDIERRAQRSEHSEQSDPKWRAEQRETDLYNRSRPGNDYSRDNSNRIPSDRPGGPKPPRQSASLNEDVEEWPLDRETSAGQATRIRTDKLRDHPQERGGSQPTPEVQQKKISRRLVGGSPTKKIPQKTEREKQLEDTLKAILEVVDHRSLSFKADDVSVQLEKCSIENADRAVNRLINFYDLRHKEGIATEKKKWESEHSKRWDAVQRENQEDRDLHQAKIDQLTIDFTSSENTIFWLKEEISEKKVAEEKRDSEIQRLRGQIQSAADRISSLQTHHATVLRDLKSKHTDDKNLAITTLRQHYEERLQVLQNDKDAVTIIQRKKFDDAQERHRRELETQATQHKADAQKLISEVGKARADAENRVSELLADFDQKKIEMAQCHEDELHDLKKDVEYYKTALADKDRNKPLADSDITSLFGKLANRVDQFATKIRWNPKLEKTWPYGDRALRHSKNESYLQQLIIQQQIWVVLDKRIFCTPFRVLAQTGAEIEKTWMTTFGETVSNCDATRMLTMQGHNTEIPSEWPEPTQRSEQWRYVTIREWMESLEQPGSRSITKQMGVAGYESTLESATRDIRDMVGKVSHSNEDSKTVKQIREMVQLAARFWLKMGSQRFRIVVLLPNLGDITADGRRREHLPEKVIARPELRRIGNSLGQQLDSIDVVVGDSEIRDVRDI
jgi:hypothetical protein